MNEQEFQQTEFSFSKKIVFESPFSMQILNENKQFSTICDLCTVVLRHNLKIRVEKEQNTAIHSDQEFETVLLVM